MHWCSKRLFLELNFLLIVFLGLNMTDFLQKADIQVLDALQRDASLSTGALAEKLHMSQSPCWRRVNKLETNGVIQRRVAVLDRQL